MAKLYYYPALGRAQQIRYVLAQGGIDWEDVVSGPSPTWKEIGGNLTTNIPMLTMDDKVFTQSSAVLRAAGRKTGLYPKDDDDAAYRVDNIIAAVDDLRSQAYKCIFGGTPDTTEAFATKVAPTHLANFARLLSDADFLCGDAVTIADLTAFDCFTNFCFNLLPGVEADYPTLTAFVERVGALPKIAEYRASEKFKKLQAFPPLKRAGECS